MDAGREPLGVLVVGVGFLGAQRAAAAVASRHARLVAVHDQNRSVAQAVAERFGATAVDHLEDAVVRDDIDLVVVATPHSDHAETVVLALHSSKHVLCEKPLAVEPDEAFELAGLADMVHCKLGTGLNHRFHPPVRDALALEHAWSIGRVESVRVEIGHAASPEFLRSWHVDPERSGGGTLIDNGPHACDLIRRFLGEVVAAKGYLQGMPGLDPRCEAEAFALFRGHENATAELHSSWNLHRGYLTIDVRGDDGHLHVETAPWRLSGVLAGGKRVERTYFAERVFERLYRRRHGCERSLVVELDDFIRGIHGHPREGASGWDGFRVSEMIEAVYQADRLGDEILMRPDHRPLRRRQPRPKVSAGRL